MSKLINAKINLNKIKDDLLYVGEKGTYLNLSIWINEGNPDKFGNTISIQQTTKKGEDKIYLGEGSSLKRKKITHLQRQRANGEARLKPGQCQILMTFRVLLMIQMLRFKIAI